ncbi:hypothetical protein AVEN_246891-1 [Araneus ventricosus]|uniref:RNase H type-1 domain-containing protein n=1 Tax=Araneus ventricosus TaxID=182803 RepID=A0A4Y2Q487_ARAVE|nr:hypothetical protein AVEN_246891-1 [Araneus ventricosus]
MIAIDMALDFVLEHQLFGEIWILSDSRSVVQYLDNWRDVSDRRGMDIFNKLKTLCNSCVLHLQWIPSHVNLKYNDIVDSLAKEGHSWYRSEGPGATIHFKGDWKDQTALACLSSGHLKTLRFSRGDKKFNICTKCNIIEATPQHLLDCVALMYDDLLKRPDFMLEVKKANDSDLIQIRRIRKKKLYHLMESLLSIYSSAAEV